jgi:DNA polymerase V
VQGLYRPGYWYHKAGVMLTDLQAQGQPQADLDLFGRDSPSGASQGNAATRLMDTVDALNRRYGRGAVTVASAAHQARHGEHAARQERRSPRSTTRLEELAVVR